MNRKRLRELADVIEGMPYMEVPEERKFENRPLCRLRGAILET